MRRRPPVLRAATSLVAAALVTGCGGGSGGTASETTTTTDQPRYPVLISSPKPDDVMTATRRAGSELGLTLTVTGKADSAQTIEVQAACPDRACSKVVFSDGAGDWSADFDLTLPARRHRLAITAGYPTTESARPPATVRVTVKAPKAPVEHRATRRKRRSRDGTRTQTAPPATAPSPSAEPTTSSPATPPTTTQTQLSTGSGIARKGLLLVGDSLAVGVKGLLPSLLPGWSVQIDGRVGRPLAEGMGIINAASLPSDGGTVLAVSLFTNDDPTHTSQLQSAVRTTLSRAGPSGCVIWATIVRPPLNGVSYAAANAALQRMAAADPRLRIVPWAERVRARPSLVGGDGVHPTPAGYQLRARMYAQAAQSC